MVNWYYSNQEQLQQIEMAVLEEQVVDYVLEKATVERVPSTYQDVISGKAIESEEQISDVSGEAEADTQKSEQNS